VDGQLKTLIELQALDTRIAALEADAARLPREIEAVRAATEEARKAVDAGRAQLDAARKDTRTREKDLEDTQVKRQKYEGQLYQVKTNKEYSAILSEIEEVKQLKGRIEEDILTLMERQERLTAEIKVAEGRLKERQAQGATEEATLRAKLAEVEGELAHVRSDRNAVARDLPPAVLGDYERVLRARGGLALAVVLKPNLCSGCRMTVTPQRLQELRQQNALIGCESCGRYLYWLA
jgi:predicted  nucleic acid-binding Zn-ribbon protein